MRTKTSKYMELIIIPSYNPHISNVIDFYHANAFKKLKTYIDYFSKQQPKYLIKL